MFYMLKRLINCILFVSELESRVVNKKMKKKYYFHVLFYASKIADAIKKCYENQFLMDDYHIYSSFKLIVMSNNIIRGYAYYTFIQLVVNSCSA